jgi:ABC-type uncharacterized transport system involved in gliding motility auxiliary subunit
MRERINLNPSFIMPPPSGDDMQSYPLAYLIEGEFPSYFKDKPIPERTAEGTEDADSENPSAGASSSSPPDTAKALPAEVESRGAFLAKGKAGKIFIMASSQMLTDNVIDAQGRGANSLFTFNVIDALNGRDDIAVMRSKVQQFNPLSSTTAGTKTVVKTFNIVGLPVLVMLFGIGVWFKRSRRKKRIQEMFQK